MGYSVGGGSIETFGLFVSVVVAVVLIATWVILAGSRFVQGGVVERSDRVPQLYGYTLCLVGLLWALLSVVAIVEDVMTMTAPDLPAANEFNYGDASISSFEAFRATYDRSRRFASGGDPSQVNLDSIPEPELRRRYEALRADRIRQVNFRARAGITTSIVSLFIGAALFVFHWRWLRRRTVAELV